MSCDGMIWIRQSLRNLEFKLMKMKKILLEASPSKMDTIMHESDLVRSQYECRTSNEKNKKKDKTTGYNIMSLIYY